MAKPIYKQVKMPMPHCPFCREQLSGNNSIALPWECACGVWQSKIHPFFGEYDIVPHLVYAVGKLNRKNE